MLLECLGDVVLRIRSPRQRHERLEESEVTGDLPTKVKYVILFVVSSRTSRAARRASLVAGRGHRTATETTGLKDTVGA